MINLTAIQDRLFADEYDGDASRDIELLLGEDAHLRTALGTCKGGLVLLQNLIRQSPASTDEMVIQVDALLGSITAIGF